MFKPALQISSIKVDVAVDASHTAESVRRIKITQEKRKEMRSKARFF